MGMPVRVFDEDVVDFAVDVSRLFNLGVSSTRISRILHFDTAPEWTGLQSMPPQGCP